MDALYAHVHRWMATPFVWGQSDCMLVLADYLVTLGYVDIGAKWRGTYNDALSCQRASGFLTNPVKPLRDGLIGILPETINPVRGDIGVIEIPNEIGKLHATGAICLGRNWAVRSQYKVICDRPARVLAAWSVARA